jgi:hypothetical protein
VSAVRSCSCCNRRHPQANHWAAAIARGRHTAKNVVRDFSQAVAATYEISVNDDTVLHLQKEPVLGWSNPVRISKYGYVFVWTDREISLVTG